MQVTRGGSPAVRTSIAAASTSVAVIAVVVLAAGAPVAWLFLGACAAIALAVVAYALAERRVFEPLPLIGAFCFVSFGIRPLQLFIGHLDLASWYPPPSPLDGLLKLENQEISLFVTKLLTRGLEGALTRTIAVCLVFLLLVVVGFALPAGRRLGGRLSDLGSGTQRLNVGRAVGMCLAIGLVAQVVILAETGGVAEATKHFADQKTLKAGFVFYFLASFPVVGLAVWLAWRRPDTRRAWLAFVVTVLEVCGFFALAGSRTRAFLLVFLLIVVANYRWRPWRLREVAVAAIALVLCSASFLAIRQASYTRSFGDSVLAAPRYVSDPRGILNDTTEFDELFVAVSSIPTRLHYQHGGWLVTAFHSYVPSFVDASRPDPPDVVFRERIWGNKVGAGRPITVAGDFFYDFGWPGLAIGSLLLGILSRALLGLVGPGDPGGRAYRVVIYAIALMVLVQLVATGYAVAIGFAATLLIPFLVAVHLFGRIPTPGRGAGRIDRAPEAPVRSRV